MTRFIIKRSEKKVRAKPDKKNKKSGTHIPICDRGKCIICDKDSVGQYSADIDLPPFPYCKKHDFDVNMYLILLLGGDRKGAESWLSFSRSPHLSKKKNK